MQTSKNSFLRGTRKKLGFLLFTFNSLWQLFQEHFPVIYEIRKWIFLLTYFSLIAYMTWKIISAYLKGFQNTEEWRFSFRNIFFRFRDTDVFLLCKLDQWSLHTTCNWKMVKYWINDISENIKAVFLKLGTTNVHHKRNKMTPLMLLPWQQFCHWCCLNKKWNSQFLS